MSLDSLVNKWEKKGLDIYISDRSNRIYLSKIAVPKERRKQGIGTKFMEDLVDYADKVNKMVTLTPSVDYGATSVSRLKSFYKRFGFVENKGRHKDFTISESMYRPITGGKTAEKILNKGKFAMNKTAIELLKIAKELSATNSIRISGVNMIATVSKCSDFFMTIQLIAKTTRDLDKIEAIGMEKFIDKINKTISVDDVEVKSNSESAGILITVDNDSLIKLMFN